MKRNTPKRAAANRAAQPMLDEFRETFPMCWICPTTYLIQTHEIVSGANRPWGRSHREALLRACCDCHANILHAQWQTTENMPMQYALKLIRDPAFYNRTMLNVARGRDPEAITADDVREATERVRRILQW